MAILLHDLILKSASGAPASHALVCQGERLSYEALAGRMEAAAQGYLKLGLARGERVAIYLDKRFDTVVAAFAAARAGCVFVPVNPLLKPDQVAYILQDCNVRILVTSAERLKLLEPVLAECPDLRAVVVAGGNVKAATIGGVHVVA